MSSIFGISWSKDELDILIEFYPKIGPLMCSRKIKSRTPRACQLKAKKINLKYNIIKEYYIEENLRKFILESTSYSNCLTRIGLSSRPGNYVTLKKYIKLYDIDISHFNSNMLKVHSLSITKPLEDVLVIDSTYGRNSLKKRLYKEGLKEKVCEICGMGEEWFNGTKIVHILDHINGIYNDNRLENLRIVCPNCNSTLDTNCGKNRGKKNIFNVTSSDNNVSGKRCICGCVIHKTSNLCVTCNGLNGRKVQRPSLESLLDDINNLGYVGTGRKYGVSDNAIRKWIKKYKNTG